MSRIKHNNIEIKVVSHKDIHDIVLDFGPTQFFQTEGKGWRVVTANICMNKRYVNLWKCLGKKQATIKKKFKKTKPIQVPYFGDLRWIPNDYDQNKSIKLYNNPACKPKSWCTLETNHCVCKFEQRVTCIPSVMNCLVKNQRNNPNLKNLLKFIKTYITALYPIGWWCGNHWKWTVKEMSTVRYKIDDGPIQKFVKNVRLKLLSKKLEIMIVSIMKFQTIYGKIPDDVAALRKDKESCTYFCAEIGAALRPLVHLIENGMGMPKGSLFLTGFYKIYKINSAPPVNEFLAELEETKKNGYNFINLKGLRFRLLQILNSIVLSQQILNCLDKSSTKKKKLPFVSDFKNKARLIQTASEKGFKYINYNDEYAYPFSPDVADLIRETMTLNISSTTILNQVLNRICDQALDGNSFSISEAILIN